MTRESQAEDIDLFASDEAIFYDAVAASMPLRYGRAHQIQNELVIELISACPSIARILEIGPGTCTDLVDILTRTSLPDLTYVGIDKSGDMLSVGRAKLPTEHLGKVKLIRADAVTETQRYEPLGSFDVCFSSFVFHHLQDAARLALHERLLDALRPGGTYIVTDLFRPSDTSNDVAAADEEVRGVETAVQEAALPRGAERDVLLRDWVQHYRAQKPPGLEREIGFLTSVGCTVTLIYTEVQVAVIKAVRGSVR